MAQRGAIVKRSAAAMIRIASGVTAAGPAQRTGGRTAIASAVTRAATETGSGTATAGITIEAETENAIAVGSAAGATRAPPHCPNHTVAGGHSLSSHHSSYTIHQDPSRT